MYQSHIDIGQTRSVGEKVKKISDKRLKPLQILDRFNNKSAYPSQSSKAHPVPIRRVPVALVLTAL